MNNHNKVDHIRVKKICVDYSLPQWYLIWCIEQILSTNFVVLTFTVTFCE